MTNPHRNIAVSPDDIANASDRIRGRVRRTPILELEAGAIAECPVTLKLEHLQLTGTFKVRGAFNNMTVEPIPESGAVAISGGNHGAAVAFAATQLGAKSTVFVPSIIADQVKIQRMRGYGAEVEVAEGTVDDAIRAYVNYANETGALAVHPYDSHGTLSGQGTVAQEFEEQAPDIDTLLVSVGGGGLIGGIAAWFAGRVKVVAVETTGTASLDKTLRGTLPDNFAASGISASGLGASSIGALPMDVIRAYVPGNIVVSDDDVVEAQRRLWEKTRILGEPGGVTALAALTSGAYTPVAGERVGVLICGGNASPDWFL